MTSLNRKYKIPGNPTWMLRALSKAAVSGQPVTVGCPCWPAWHVGGDKPMSPVSALVPSSLTRLIGFEWGGHSCQ